MRNSAGECLLKIKKGADIDMGFTKLFYNLTLAWIPYYLACIYREDVPVHIIERVLTLSQ